MNISNFNSYSFCECPHVQVKELTMSLPHDPSTNFSSYISSCYLITVMSSLHFVNFWLIILLWCKTNVVVFSSSWWSYWDPIFQNLSSRSWQIKVVNFSLINMMHLFTSFIYPMSFVPLDFILRFIYVSMPILYMKWNFLSTYIYISMQSLFIS